MDADPLTPEPGSPKPRDSKENPLLPVFKQEGCIIPLELMRTLAKVLRYQKLLLSDAQWIEEFLRHFHSSSNSYFAEPTETAVIEDYSREYWRITCRVLKEIPNLDQLMRAFASDDSRRAVEQPPATPSAFRPQGKNKAKFDVAARTRNFNEEWGLKIAGPSSDTAPLTRDDILTTMSLAATCSYANVKGPYYFTQVFESMQQKFPNAPIASDWQKVLQCCETAAKYIAEHSPEVEAANSNEMASLEASIAQVTISDKGKRKA